MPLCHTTNPEKALLPGILATITLLRERGELPATVLLAPCCFARLRDEVEAAGAAAIVRDGALALADGLTVREIDPCPFR